MLEEYLRLLEEHGASVVHRLQAGASESQLETLSSVPEVTLTTQVKDFWRRVNGVDAYEPWDHSHLFGIWMPQSVEQTIETDNVQAQLRAQGVIDTETDYRFWPPGIIRFLGENGNGAYVNCRANSPTYGAVYEKSVSEEPLVRAANSMNDYFRYLVAAFQEGAITVSLEDTEMSSKGALHTNYQKLHSIGRKMCPDCPAFDRNHDPIFNDPDWI